MSTANEKRRMCCIEAEAGEMLGIYHGPGLGEESKGASQGIRRLKKA